MQIQHRYVTFSLLYLPKRKTTLNVRYFTMLYKKRLLTTVHTCNRYAVFLDDRFRRKPSFPGKKSITILVFQSISHKLFCKDYNSGRQVNIIIHHFADCMGDGMVGEVWRLRLALYNTASGVILCKTKTSWSIAWSIHNTDSHRSF